MAQKVSFEVAKALKEAGYPQELPSQMENGGVKIPKFPSYIDAWLWLWNTKNIQIEVADKSYFAKAKVMGKFFVETDPEKAIASAIDYLVENNLIK